MMEAGLPDDETLMRFADGELDDDAAARVAEAIDADPAVAARAALFLESRTAVKAALSPLIEEPVPSALVSRVEAMTAAHRAVQDAQAGVVPRPVRRLAPSFRWTLPLAASLAAAVAAGMLAGSWLTAPDRARFELALGPVEGDLTHALSTVRTGGEIKLDAGAFRGIATFLDRSATLCREFELDTEVRRTFVAVACQARGGWSVEFAVAASADSQSGYAPASSHEAVDAYLNAIEARPPLGPEDEARALAAAGGVRE